MKKAIMPILALLPLLFFSCKDKKKAEEATKDVPLLNKAETANNGPETRTIVGKFKMVEWNDPTTILNAEEKQNVMNTTEIEITGDGKWVTRAEGKENAVNYTYFENTSTMNLPDDDGKMQSLKLSFSGNRIRLVGDNGSVVLERL